MSWNSSTMIDAETQLLALPHLALSRSRSRACSCRSSKSSATRVLRRLIRRGESVQRLLEDSRSRAAVVERRLLDACVPPRNSRRAHRVPWSPHRSSSRSASLVVRERARLRGGARCVSVAAASSARQRAASARLASAIGEARPLAELEHEVAAGGAQRPVDAGEHPPQPGGAVRREQAQPFRLGVARRTRRAPPRTPRRGGQPPAPRRARGNAGRARPRADTSSAAGCRSRGSSRSTRRRARARGRAAELDSARARMRERSSPAARLRVRDDEDGVDVEPVVADRAHEALDEHLVLPVPAPAETKTGPSRRPLPAARVFMRAPPGTSAIGRTTTGTSRRVGSCVDVAGADPLRERPRVVTRRLDRAQNSSSSR